MCDAGMEQKWHVMGGEGLHHAFHHTDHPSTAV